MNFEDYFEETKIIKYLAKIRVSASLMRHQKQFLINISNSEKLRTELEEIYSMFPSRSKWKRPNKNSRLGKNTDEINTTSLVNSVFDTRISSKNRSYDWQKKLLNQVNLVREKAFSDKHAILDSPSMIYIFKKDNVYRPISIYSLTDRVVLGLTARYLRDLFDPFMSNTSYAFRKPREMAAITHHDAVIDIISFNRRMRKKHLWVAECDIKGFFDNINHGVSIDCLNNFVRKLDEKDVNVDVRALKIFHSGILSYSYQYAIDQSQIWFQKNGIKGIIKNHTPDLERHYDKIDLTKIGIPQGGALSGLIANLVLHRADTEIEKQKNSSIHYARFCDDMILITRTRSECKDAFEKYRTVLDTLKLPYHKQLRVKQYPSYVKANGEKEEFWELKSKAPYKWTIPRTYSTDVPWVGFVGYQVRFDLLIRVRPSSLKKELEKQVQECDRVINLIKKTINNSKKSREDIKLNKRQIVFRLQQRLISMSIGRRPIEIYNDDDLFSGFCWMDGFRLLKENNHIGNQLKRLDKNRERQIQRLKRFLNGLYLQKKKQTKTPKSLNFYGKPFSYYGQCDSK